MDGITIAGKQKNYRLETPWAAEPTSERIPGSLSSARIFVPSKELRELLIEFSSSKGISDTQYASLKAGLQGLPGDAPTRALLPFIEAASSDAQGNRHPGDNDR